jgi:hypothetical protein
MAVGRPTNLFFVCSARPGVGKTLTARLCVEFQHANERPVAAFDLGSDGLALAEFLPEFTTPASIADIRGQMALFERLASDDGAPKIVDVGHLALAPLFVIMRDVDFAAEARRRSIQPIVLFVATLDEVSARAYTILREQFPDFVFVPVNNEAITRGHDPGALFAPSLAGAPLLQIPPLSADLQAVSEQRPCSFADLYRRLQYDLPDDLWNELGDWLRHCFRQLRELDLMLLANDLNSSFGEG